ncbi:hypothetical protein BC827DRAFT_3897 [Russula dissimulans]|nr:hypothetical protein BC827DRAFT_3897 [Russula dissimulans]
MLSTELDIPLLLVLATGKANDTRNVVVPVFLLPTLFETFFFGVYSALFVFSIIILYRRSPSPTRHVMMTLSVAMYVVSAAHWALSIALAEAITIGRPARAIMLEFLIIYSPTINYILGDGIVLWRAWVLWNRRLSLFIFPLVSMLCTLGTGVASAIYFYQGQVSKVNSHKTILSLHFEWSIWFLTFGTNLWATGLIFVQAWQHRRFLRSLRIKETFRTSTEKALAFLVESGALYLVIWIIYISTSMTLDPNGMFFFHTAIAQLVGIYPTTIVIVVAMQLSAADILSRPGAEADSRIVVSPQPPSPQPK